MYDGVTPTFGSRFGDLVAAIVLALIALVILYTLQQRTDTPEGTAVASGVSYLGLCAFVYLVPRYVVDGFVSGVFAAQFVAWLLLFVVPLILLQGGVPVFLFVAHQNSGALAGLFLATVFTFWALLGTGGEGNILPLYHVVVFPIATVLIGGAAGMDLVVRKVGKRGGF